MPATGRSSSLPTTKHTKGTKDTKGTKMGFVYFVYFVNFVVNSAPTLLNLDASN